MKARSKTQVRPEVCKFIKIANISTPCTGLLLRQNVYYEQESPKSMFSALTKITTLQSRTVLDSICISFTFTPAHNQCHNAKNNSLQTVHPNF